MNLFDALEEPDDVAALRAELAAAEREVAQLKSVEWREVPDHVFRAWPMRKQLAYCAARDDDAALHATTDEWRVFYQERAAAYRSA